MKRLVISAAAVCMMSTLLLGARAEAQSCNQSNTEAWAMRSQYFWEVYDHVYNYVADYPEYASNHTIDYFSQVYGRTPPSLSSSTIVLLGMSRTSGTFWGAGPTIKVAWTVPAVCVIPAGKTAAEGKLYAVGSPRYSSSNPSTNYDSFLRLRDDTSICFGDGDDSVTVVKEHTPCGKYGTGLLPINYYGYPLIVYGDGGNDTLRGASGEDWLNGGTGNDLVAGGSGDDILSGDIGSDSLSGDGGNDISAAGPGMDSLYDGGGSLDSHLGHDGNDCFSDAASYSINGQAGTDIAGSTTRSGAQQVYSIEESSGWCIPW